MNQHDQFLVSVDQLSLALKHPEPDQPLVVIDCRFSLLEPELGRSQYDEAHIHGAHYADLDHDLAARVDSGSGRHPLPEIKNFQKLVARWGIRPRSRVIVYDHGSGAIAARLWWMLRWAGHNQVALLDGGFNSWTKAGMPVTIHSEQTKPTSSDPAIALKPDSAKCLSTNELQRSMSRITLIDARDKQRFEGKIEPIDPVAGHIPGALNAPFEENLDRDGNFLPVEMLRLRFDKILQDQEVQDYSKVVHMCGSGVTACHNLFAMELAGMTGSRLYVGSWSEWIRDVARPIVGSNLNY